MRRVERIAGALAGLLAIVAGALSLALPAVLMSGNSIAFGPSVSDHMHSLLMPPVALTALAALALGAVALFDTRGARRNWTLAVLGLVAAALCALGASVMLTSPISLVTAQLSMYTPTAYLQFGAGAPFIPALIAAVVCLVAMLWPRGARPAATA